jgi:carbon monoxide dehydrogenase subunit G
VELTHEFTVPASVEETWTALTDIEGVAGCFPGATVSSVEGDSFKGTVKVKLGPISLTYNGSGEFTGKDDAAHTMTLAAKGKDRRGNGTAGADVTASMEPDGEGTRVKVVTDLQITGKPAQFGRGVIQDVSDKLLGQFTDCLAKRLSGPAPEPEAAAAAPEPEAAAAAAAPEAAAAAAPDAAAVAGQDAGPASPSGGDQDAGPASQPSGAAAAPSPAADQDAGPASVAAPAAEQVTPISSAPSAASSAGAAASSAASSADEPLDLGATLLPILVKNYGKQLGAGVGVLVFLLLLRRLLRR